MKSVINAEAEKVVDPMERRDTEGAAAALVPVLSEDRIAAEFVDRHADTVRFNWTSSEWHIWSGNRWRRDTTRAAFAWTRSLARSMARDQPAAERRRMGSRRFAEGVEQFARTDQRVAVTHEHWDCDPDLLGTPDGLVDLRNGDLFDATPDRFITRATAVNPSDIIDCLEWLRFLNQITNHDKALKTFLQRYIGYSLTGETREQKLAFIYGPGGTGKSTFAQTILQILGDYGTTADMGTFTNSSFDQHPEQLARLAGVRLVVANETEAGHAWRENRIKQMTGSDQITARFMRQNSFTFSPAFKLMFLGNHAPALKNFDTAISRRVQIVPFLHKPAEPDLHLDAKLAQEWPGILRWAINGAVDWYTSGLTIPKAVTEATTQYFDEQNLFRAWQEECCVVDPGNENIMATSVELFASWFAFAKRNGEEAGNQRGFNEKLRHNGFESKQIKALNTKGCRGIRLKQSSCWQEAAG